MVTEETFVLGTYNPTDTDKYSGQFNRAGSYIEINSGNLSTYRKSPGGSWGVGLDFGTDAPKFIHCVANLGAIQFIAGNYKNGDRIVLYGECYPYKNSNSCTGRDGSGTGRFCFPTYINQWYPHKLNGPGSSYIANLDSYHVFEEFIMFNNSWYSTSY